MKIFHLFCILPAGVFGALVGPLPAPEFVDTEVSAHHPLVQGSFGLKGLDFRLEFTGTPSNNVEVAFGRDGDEDGALAPHETDVVVGWSDPQWASQHPSRV